MVKRAKKPQRKRKTGGLDAIPYVGPPLEEREREELDELRHALAKATSRPDWRPAGPAPGGGRPRLPDDDIKSVRYAIRMHADLKREIEGLARADGLLLSVWLNHLLVRTVNERHRHEVLDLFGKYRSGRDLG